MSTKYEVRYTSAAEADLRGILSYISTENVSGAEEFIREMQRQIETLKTLPHRCPVIPERDSVSGSYRHMIFGRYRAIFQVSGKTVYVLRVIHGARLLDPIEFGDIIPE